MCGNTVAETMKWWAWVIEIKIIDFVETETSKYLDFIEILLQ